MPPAASAWSGVNYAGASSGPTTPGYASAVSFTETQMGYVVGGGVEFLSWDRWLVRGEYLFHHFDGASAGRRGGGLPGLPVRAINVERVRHPRVFRAALSYKF